MVSSPDCHKKQAAGDRRKTQGASESGVPRSRVHLDDARKTSPKPLEQLIESAPQGIVFLDTDGRIALANKSAREMLGAKRRGIIGRMHDDPAWRIARADGRPMPEESLPFARVVRTGRRASDVELVVSRVDGTRAVLSVSAVPVRGSDGTLAGVVESFQDITKRERTEAQLRREQKQAEALAELLSQERELLQLTMENTDTKLAYLDTDFNFVMVNSAYARGSGYKTRELVGRNHFELFPDQENQRIFERVRDTGKAAAFKAKPFRYVNQPERDVTFWDWTLTPVKKKRSGETKGLVLSLREVTAEIRAKQLDDALRHIDDFIGSTLDFDEIMEHVVVHVTGVLGCDSSAITLREGDDWVVRYTHGLPARAIGVRLPDGGVRHLKVLLKKNPAVLDDLLDEDGLLSHLARRFGVRCAVVAPLKSGNELIGAITFHSAVRDHNWTHAQTDFIVKLASSVSLAIENANLYASVQEELSHTQILEQLALAATTKPDLVGTASGILQTLVRHLHLKAGDICTLHPEQEMLRLVATHGLPRETLDQRQEIPLTMRDLLTVRAVLEDRPLTHEDSPSAATTRALKKAGLASSRCIACPIRFRGKTVGTLTLAFEGKRPFTQGELNLFLSISNVAGQVMESARLFDAHVQAEARAASELYASNLLLDAAVLLNGSLDLREILDCLADILRKVTGKSRIIVNLLDTKGEQMTVAVAQGPSLPPVGTKTRLSSFSPECRAALESKKPTVIDLSDARQPAVAKQRSKEHNLKRWLLVPLIVGDKIVGQIGLDEPGRLTDFTPREVKLVEGIAAQAAVVIENARLHQRSVAETRTLEVVSQMGSLVTSELRIEETYRQIVGYSSLLLNAPSSLLLMLDKKTGVFRLVARTGASFRVARKTLSRAEVARLHLNGPTPILLEDLSALRDVPFFTADAKEDFVSAIVLALSLDKAIDCLLVIQDRKPLSPTKADMFALSIFAGQAATAIRNARLYEQQRRIAETLQSSLRGVPIDVPGLEVGIVYGSAFEAEQVGGDFYDVFEVEDGDVAVLIGDVSGKGVGAAALTETIRSSVRTLAYIDPSPAFVFSRLNHSLLRMIDDDTFATAALLAINVHTGNVRITGAGHPRPIICGKECHYLRIPTAMPLGVDAESYRESYLKLEPNQILVLYTDGITEARRGPELLGERRLLRTLHGCCNQKPQKIVDALLKSATKFANGKLTDDMALMALRLTK